MKVLWFANTPCNADEYFNSELKGTGGWLKALDIEMQDQVDLHIAFYSRYNIAPFKYKKTNYYPIFIKKTVIKKLYERLTNYVVFKEHVDIYLKIVEQVKPDIIHVHGTENPFGYLSNVTEIPVVISIQGNVTAIYNKYLSGIEKKYLRLTNFSFYNPLGIFKNFRSSYVLFYKMMLREQDILKSIKYIIGRTDWDYYITRVLAPQSNYYHGDEILRKGFYSNAGRWKPHNREKKIILTVTGPLFYKGLETLCHALFELQNTGVDVEWKIAGVNSNDLIVKIIRRKLGKKYPQKGLKFLGNLNEKEIVKQLIDADIYVMPSHIENSPNNLCEAQMIGVPCVATYAGGTNSILNSSTHNLLIQDGDPWAMAGVIITIFRKKNTGKKTAQIQTIKHNKELIVKNLIKTYTDIINDKVD